jgi:hypothetical protein
MSDENNQRITGRPADYNKWVMVFCFGVLVFIGLFYYATQKIQYNWRWNRTPIYFAYQDDIDVTSPQPSMAKCPPSERMATR